MSPTEFAERMTEIAETAKDDPEGAHLDADRLLCKLLDELGYSEGVKIFEAMDKWYS